MKSQVLPPMTCFLQQGHTSKTCPNSTTEWEPSIQRPETKDRKSQKWRNESQILTLVPSRPPTHCLPLGPWVSISLPRVACKEYRSQNLSVQPRCGVVQNLPNSTPVTNRQADPTMGKQFLFSAGLSTDFQHQRIVFTGVCVWGLFWRLERDERHLCPGRAEASTLPRSRLEVGQASM